MHNIEYVFVFVVQVWYICTTIILKYMATVKAFIRSGKKDAPANVRFRLSNGRGMQFFHVSEIIVLPSLWDQKKESYKPKVIVPLHCTSRDAFYREVTDRKNLILKLFSENNIENSNSLNLLIDQTIHPEKYVSKEIPKYLTAIFYEYIDRCYNDKIFGLGRKKHYDVLLKELNRFLIINKISDIKPIDFTSDKLILFRDFLLNEHTLTEKYSGLYVGMNDRNIPKKPRNQNTVATKLKKLQAFFSDMESNDEIAISPFRKIGKQRKTVMMREQYDEPIYLTKDEFLCVKESIVPEPLQETKDVFLLHCSLGCRISDFKALSFANISIEENIPYIHYLPQKTKNEGDTRKEIRTPLMSFSLEVIKKYDFTFPILNYVTGERGYNDKIKALLKHCGINRLVAVYNSVEEKNEYKPINELASSKLARKTHVDMMNKVQINQYAAGLHKKGSNAVERYTAMSIMDRFILMCAAFECEPYKVNDNLDVVG